MLTVTALMFTKNGCHPSDWAGGGVWTIRDAKLPLNVIT